MKSYEELLEENRLLREKLEECRSSDVPNAVREADTLLSSTETKRKVYERGSYLSFLFGNFRSSVFYRLYRRVYRVFRPTMIIVRFIRFLMMFLTMLQASVVILFLTILSLAVLPLLLIAFLFVFVRVLFDRRALHGSVADAFRRKKVLVFFSSDVGGSFFDRNMQTLLPEYTVIVVQEGKGIFGDRVIDSEGRKRRFLTACRMAPGYYRIRRHYFFYVRKRYFGSASSIAMIY